MQFNQLGEFQSTWIELRAVSSGIVLLFRVSCDVFTSFGCGFPRIATWRSNGVPNTLVDCVVYFDYGWVLAGGEEEWIYWRGVEE